MRPESRRGGSTTTLEKLARPGARAAVELFLPVGVSNASQGVADPGVFMVPASDFDTQKGCQLLGGGTVA